MTIHPLAPLLSPLNFPTDNQQRKDLHWNKRARPRIPNQGYRRPQPVICRNNYNAIILHFSVPLNHQFMTAQEPRNKPLNRFQWRNATSLCVTSRIGERTGPVLFFHYALTQKTATTGSQSWTIMLFINNTLFVVCASVVSLGWVTAFNMR